MSRDLEVTPPCSIRPLPFGDVLVVRTRNDWQKSERRLVKKKKKGVSEHDANEENKIKTKEMRLNQKGKSISEHESIPKLEASD